MSCLCQLPSPLSCPLSSSCYPRIRPPLNHTLDCPQVLQQHSDNPFNHSCPTKLFYTASTAGFCRYIVCIPIYPYSLISILLFSISVHLPSRNFVDNIPSNHSQVFYHFILFPLLLIFLSSCCILTGFDSAYNLHERSLCSDATRRPRGRARTLSLGLPLPPPSLCAPNSTDRTLVPLTWSPQASTCSSTRPRAAREGDYTRGGRHEGKKAGSVDILRS